MSREHGSTRTDRFEIRSARLVWHGVLLAALIQLAVPDVASAGPIELSAFGPGAVQLDFDELDPGTVLTNQYAGLGVSFSNAYVDHDPAFAVSPPNLIRGTAPITISFADPVVRVGIQIDRDGYNPDRQPQFLAYDPGGVLLGTIDFGQGPDFAGWESAGGIGSVVLGSIGPGGGFGYSDGHDNLIFETPEAPEPSTALLMLCGAWLMRRRVRCAV